MARRKKQHRHVWTKPELALLRRQYPGRYTPEIAKALGLALHRVHRKALKLGLRKSAAFRRMQRADEARRLRVVGVAHRFQKGLVPANKGLRMPGWAPGRSGETQFKKGHPANNYMEIGTLRLNADGYVDMKIREAPGSRAWRGFHLILWEDKHGPLPKGYCLRFRDGDRFHIDLDNLEMLTRTDNMLRNSIHNLPKPLADTIQMLGQLKRRIRNAARRNGTAHAVI